jgi:hypothetical protein
MPPALSDSAPAETPSDTAALLSWLATRDAPCPVCGYNLRALPAPRCPECSAPLSLHVYSENASIGPWLVALGSYALAAGFDGVVTLMMLTVALILEPPPPSAWAFVGSIIAAFATLTLVCLISIFWLATRRRRFWRLPRRTQWIAAATVFAAVFLVHAAFGAFLSVTL